ncbi:MAG: hypothetical protein AABY93_10720 [Bacteroidota bacterium]
MIADMNHPLTFIIITIVVAIVIGVSGFFLNREFVKKEKAKLIKHDQDKIYKWLMDEFRVRMDFEYRTTKAISSGTHLSEDRVKEVAIIDSRIHKSTGSKDDRWTVRSKPFLVNWKKNSVAEVSSEQPKKSDPKIIKGGQVGIATPSFNSSINSAILGQERGVFSIWGYVADVHNKVYEEQLNMYIVGYATNRGQDLQNPSMARYPNTWAIDRVAPTKKNLLGSWRFYSNNSGKAITQLNCTDLLTNGWHLFSVAWSISDNYIKFIIDESEVAQSEFSNWPSDFSHSIQVGTWASRSPEFFFKSKIGQWQFAPVQYKLNIIEEFFIKKPE